MKLLLTRDIPTPPATVFYWLGDHERAKTWMTSVSATELIQETPNHVGTKFRERVTKDGRSVVITGEITAWVENELISFHLFSAYNETEVSYRLIEIGGLTRLSIEADIRFRGITRLVMLVAGRKFRAEVEAQFERELDALEELCVSGEGVVRLK